MGLPDTTDQQIADAFVRLLRQTLTREEFAEMQRRNATPEYRDTGCCASHDFCDANEVMDAAFRACGIVIDDLGDDDNHARWNRAWNLAKLEITAPAIRHGGRNA